MREVRQRRKRSRLLTRVIRLMPLVFLLLAGGLNLVRRERVGAASGPETGHRPNIVFAIADDWSWPHAGVYGDRVVKTPTFDELARQGVLFRNAYCAAPSCTPSRGQSLPVKPSTGLRPVATCGVPCQKNSESTQTFWKRQDTSSVIREKVGDREV